MLSKAFCAFGLIAVANLVGAQTTATPKPWKGTDIVTSSGSFTIEGVEVGDKFPPGCGEPGPTCSPAEPGYKVLMVWLKAKGDALQAAGGLAKNLGEARVKSDDGGSTASFSGGMLNQQLFVAFTPPLAAKNFMLHWEENPPISLGK